MEIKGKIKAILEPVRGTSARGEWVKCEAVITYGDEYPKDCCLSFWADNAEVVSKLPIDSVIEASFNPESREHNGRYFTECRVWRFKVLEEGHVLGTPYPSNLDAEYAAATGYVGPSDSKADDSNEPPF